MKKILSIILVLAMLLGMVSMIGVLAVEETTTWTKVEGGLSAIQPEDTIAITITTKEGKTYVLPTAAVSKSTDIALVEGTISTVGTETKLSVNGTSTAYGWNFTSVTGGYQIKSGSNYLCGFHHSANGIKIGATDAPTVWTMVSTRNLLGFKDTDADCWHTLGVCIKDTIYSGSTACDKTHSGWHAFANYTAAEQNSDAFSHVRANVVNFWKLDITHTCADAPADGDHLCDSDTCQQPMADAQCADGADEDHNCDDCGKNLCSDAENDGDHKCDVCDREVEFSHADTDNDGHCDECTANICTEHKDETTKDHKCDICGETVSPCEDKADDGDHKCDICGKEDVSTCADSDTDKDHKCDDCGKDGLNDCTDSATDADHKCDVCGKDEMNECVDVDTDKDHKCDVCGKDELNEHVWVPATIDAPKTCSVCGATEGEPLPKSPTPEVSHWVKVDGLDKICEGEYLVITITIEDKTYVLSNAEAKNSSTQPDLTILGEISSDGRFLTVGDGSKASGYNFSVVPVTGGFQIKSGNMDLWIAAGDTGLRISSADNAAVWNVGKCGLLVAEDPNGNWRTMCIRDNAWKSFKTYDNTADGNAHSTVRNNILGLWKYVPVTSSGGTTGGTTGGNTSGGNTSGGNTSGGTTGGNTSGGTTGGNTSGGNTNVPSNGDTALSTIIALMVISGMGLVTTVSKKKEF